MVLPNTRNFAAMLLATAAVMGACTQTPAVEPQTSAVDTRMPSSVSHCGEHYA